MFPLVVTLPIRDYICWTSLDNNLDLIKLFRINEVSLNLNVVIWNLDFKNNLSIAGHPVVPRLSHVPWRNQLWQLLERWQALAFLLLSYFLLVNHRKGIILWELPIIYTPTYLPTYPLTYPLTYLPTYLHTYMPSYLTTCLLMYLSAYLLFKSFVCLCVLERQLRYGWGGIFGNIFAVNPLIKLHIVIRRCSLDIFLLSSMSITYCVVLKFLVLHCRAQLELVQI
jgi:hypothetical protein